MIITPHFSSEEFGRPQRIRAKKLFPACPYPQHWLESRLRPLCELLEVIRAGLGNRTIRIASGYREPKYNVAIGGAPKSQHMQGKAADITVSNMDAGEVHARILEMFKKGELKKLGGLGRYPTFVHVDIRPTKGGRLFQWSGSRIEE